MKDSKKLADGMGQGKMDRLRGSMTGTPDTKSVKVASPATRRTEARATSDRLRSTDEPFPIAANPTTRSSESAIDLVCLSHLRWDFVYQRPQHLLSRCATARRVFFIEEPVYDNGPVRMHVSERECGVVVMVPWLPERLQDDPSRDAVLRSLLERFFTAQKIDDYLLWYYTPMALTFTQHLRPRAVIYDCMDELSAFRDAPPALRFCEGELFRRADLVFTGGQSLYESKRKQHPKHPHIHAFPSSIDAAHFAQARNTMSEPADQADIPYPRLGFFGVVDERIDLELLDRISRARPDWQFVIVGPVVKIEQASLPRRANLHYLGGKAYRELPEYLAGWDVALMPFALNDATRFISPTKTPEYLAAGRPVVSTSIRDVVRPYGEQGLVRIADTADDFIGAAEAALSEDATARQAAVDKFLAQTSWDMTWARMSELIEDAIDDGRATADAADSRNLKQRGAGAEPAAVNFSVAS
ncbi:MAG TPA: glycosyltransferase family 1 protein [Pyrinomonadaceae bacterium]|jgi:UDP-galactopyranose mutase